MTRMKLIKRIFLLPALVFHGIILVSQSFHRHTEWQLLLKRKKIRPDPPYQRHLRSYHPRSYLR